MLDNLLNLYKDMSAMATEWFVGKVRLIQDAGYIHLCPACQNDIHISDPKEENTQRVVTCKCCGSKYVVKVGKHRK